MNNSASQDLSRVLRTRLEACTHRCTPTGASCMVLSPVFSPPVRFDSPLTTAPAHEGREEWSMFQLYGRDRAGGFQGLDIDTPPPELSRGEQQWRGMCLGLFDGESPTLKEVYSNPARFLHILSRCQ